MHLAPQVLVNCVSANHSRGCHGGDTTAAFAYMAAHGVPDESCQNYIAEGNGKNCSAINICMNCAPKKGCWPVTEAMGMVLHRVEEHGQVFGEQNMMAEVVSRGPITCTIGCPDTLESYTGGIYEDKTGDKKPDHDIEVTGFGEENGTKYWHVRNSWGKYWYEDASHQHS
eukprot:SAG22_NODE_1613_length_3995_cov_4.374230_5_plen_170_part_00